jgi:hypothetical protein
MSILDFVDTPPGCGWSVTDFWGWDAHEAHLRCPDEVDGDIYEYGVPGGALNLNSTYYPDHGHHGDPPLWGKNPHDRAGNRTWDLMISSQKCWPLDHEAGLLHIIYIYLFSQSHWPRSLRRRSTAAHLLQSWVQISLGLWMSVVCVLHVVR